MKLKLAYFGTPDFSAHFLEKLLTDNDLSQILQIKLIVTQPDKPVGRKQILTASPVKLIAKKFGIKIFDNDFATDGASGKTLREADCPALAGQSLAEERCRERQYLLRELLYKIDLSLLYAYGKIVPPDILKIPKHGFWNIHPSLLPQYRGPSPMAYPLILGDKKTGVSLMVMDEKMDHGPIISRSEIDILPHDKRSDLEIKLTDLGFDLFKNVFLKFTYRISKQRNKNADYHLLRGENQNHSLATYTRMLKKEDGFIPFATFKKAVAGQPLTTAETPTVIKEYLQKLQTPNSKFQINSMPQILNSPKIIFNYFRGLYPWPGLWTTIRGNFVQEKRLKITDLDLMSNRLLIKKVQLEGKKEADFSTFNRAYKLF